MSRDSRRLRLVLAFLLLASLTLLTIDYRSNGQSPLRPVERAVAAVIGPGERAVASAVRPIGNLTRLGGDQHKVDALQKQVDQLTLQLAGSDAARRRAAELDRLLGYDARYYTMKAARVVGWGDALGYERTVTVDIGTSDGVHKDMTVLNGSGLVGKVIQADRSSCTVLLADDQKTVVGVRVSRSGEIGEVEGRPDGTLRLTLLAQNKPPHVGDTVLTLGSKDSVPYVPDVPVGEVVSVENTPGAQTHTAVVDTFADFTALDTVAVVFPPAKRPARDALVPTTPPQRSTSASPSASAPATTGGGP